MKNSVLYPAAKSKCLFPSIDPGRPLSAARLGERLRRLGIEPAAARRAAMSHLAASLPAAAITQALGVSPHTAVRWSRDAGADWTSYAARVVHDG